MFTLLKNGAPTLIRDPESASDNTGKSVPERTAMQETNRIKLLNRKLDSRETMAIQLVFALQIVTVLDVSHEADQKDYASGNQRTSRRYWTAQKRGRS